MSCPKKVSIKELLQLVLSPMLAGTARRETVTAGQRGPAMTLVRTCEKGATIWQVARMVPMLTSPVLWTRAVMVLAMTKMPAIKAELQGSSLFQRQLHDDLKVDTKVSVSKTK